MRACVCQDNAEGKQTTGTWPGMALLAPVRRLGTGVAGKPWCGETLAGGNLEPSVFLTEL